MGVQSVLTWWGKLKGWSWRDPAGKHGDGDYWGGCGGDQITGGTEVRANGLAVSGRSYCLMMDEVSLCFFGGLTYMV